MKLVSTFFLMLFAVAAFAIGSNIPVKSELNQPGMEMLGELPQESHALSVKSFLELTPKKYKEMTGKKLGFKNTLKLKAAQKVMKKKYHPNGADIPQGLYIVGVILGWGWLLMGLMDDFSGNNWWVNLILVALCWLPGVVHGLIKMKDYY